MLFSSLEFICWFLPLFIAAYFLALLVFRKHLWVRNAVLLVFSLIFYAWGEYKYILLLLLSIVFNWMFAFIIDEFDKMQKKGLKKLTFIFSLVFNLGMLGIFKYADFAVAGINSLFRTDITLPGIALPIGISFFTFQIMSYVIDVYRGQVPMQRNIFIVAVYLCAFPQLIAGPIVRYADVEKELAERKETLDKATTGTLRFVTGLAKKVIIANTCAALCDTLFEHSAETFGAVGAWIGMFAYTLQIYFDFSGYSDMAIGLGKIMGFEYKENFNNPYIATSVTDFWRRWHISLSTFFREYVYIPLGGNRVSKPRHILNLLIVWSLTGLWHGASWNFVLWGLYYGVLLVIEKYTFGKHLEKLHVLNHIYSLFAIVIGWTLFRFETVKDLGNIFRAMFGGYGFTGVNGQAWTWLGQSGFDMKFLIIFAIGILCSCKLPNVFKGLNENGKLFLKSVFSLALFLLCILFMEVGAYNPFIYFRF